MESMSWPLTPKSHSLISPGVDQDVGRLHVSVHDLVFLPEVCQAPQNRNADLAQDLFRDSLGFFQHLVQGAAIHVLHADADLAVAVEGPVEAHNVRELHSCSTCSSRMIWFRMAGLISRWISFLAMMRPEGLCWTLVTTPPLPAPSSEIRSKSSSLSSPTLAFCKEGFQPLLLLLVEL